MNNLKRRVAELEGKAKPQGLAMPFLWGWGQTLDEALIEAGLSLDQHVFAIELMPFGGVADAARLADRARLEPIKLGAVRGA